MFMFMSWSEAQSTVWTLKMLPLAQTVDGCKILAWSKLEFSRL